VGTFDRGVLLRLRLGLRLLLLLLAESFLARLLGGLTGFLLLLLALFLRNALGLELLLALRFAGLLQCLTRLLFLLTFGLRGFLQRALLFRDDTRVGLLRSGGRLLRLRWRELLLLRGAVLLELLFAPSLRFLQSSALLLGNRAGVGLGRCGG